MKKRPLGNTGVQIAPLVFGGNVFGWTADEETSFRLLDVFVDAGFDAIDTADFYSRWLPGHQGGESETIIGNWLAANPSKRQKVVLLTKVGMDMGGLRRGLSRRWIVEAVEASLRRLRTDVIDLYQSHLFDPATPQEETLEAYQTLMTQGKVRAIGCSNFDEGQLAAALRTSESEGLPRYATLQPRYNLLVRSSFEHSLRDFTVAKGVSVIPYSALAGGFLTGKYRSAADLAMSARGSMVGQYLDARGLRILGVLDRVATRHGVTPAQVALAWLMTRKGVLAPIVSATSVPQLADLMASVSLILSDDDITELDRASA